MYTYYTFNLIKIKNIQSYFNLSRVYQNTESLKFGFDDFKLDRTRQEIIPIFCYFFILKS